MDNVVEQLAQQLRAISVYTTTEIVMLAALETGAHYATVQRYLRGEVKKIPFAKKLLQTIIDLLHKHSITFKYENTETQQ